MKFKSCGFSLYYLLLLSTSSYTGLICMISAFRMSLLPSGLPRLRWLFVPPSCQAVLSALCLAGLLCDLLLAAIFFFWLLFLAFCAALFLQPSLTSQHDSFLLFYRPFNHSMLTVDLVPLVLCCCLQMPGCLGDAASLPKLFSFFFSLFQIWGFLNA